jgi:hypothetical protein
MSGNSIRLGHNRTNQDTGRRRRTFPPLLQALPSQPPYDKTFVKAIAPGTATLQLAFASQVLILNVHVVMWKDRVNSIFVL